MPNWFSGSSQQPFLIISRSCGMALDTAFQRTDESWPILWPPHGLAHQLWSVRKTKGQKDYSIISLDNGLSLDSTLDNSEGVHLTMYAHHGSTQQRWLIERAGEDRLGWSISSVRSRLQLFSPAEAESKWTPWLEKSHDLGAQWLIVPVKKNGFR